MSTTHDVFLFSQIGVGLVSTVHYRNVELLGANCVLVATRIDALVSPRNGLCALWLTNLIMARLSNSVRRRERGLQ